jgi:hypothetical protein
MQRDMDLVRQLLLTIEAQDSALLVIDDLVVKNYDDETVSEHIRLMAQAGLIDVFASEYMDDTAKMALSWFGHEFLDTARDDARWKNAKKAGSVSFDVLKNVLTTLASQAAKTALGLP